MDKHTRFYLRYDTSVLFERRTNFKVQSFSDSDDRISPELLAERIKANLKPPIEQISDLNKLLNQPIQHNSATTTPTVSSHVRRSNTGPSFDREKGASITSPDSDIWKCSANIFSTGSDKKEHSIVW